MGFRHVQKTVSALSTVNILGGPLGLVVMRLLVGQVRGVLCRLCLAYSGGIPRRTCAFFLLLTLGFVGLGSGLCASVLEMSVVLRERFQFIHSFILYEMHGMHSLFCVE